MTRHATRLVLAITSAVVGASALGGVRLIGQAEQAPTPPTPTTVVLDIGDDEPYRSWTIDGARLSYSRHYRLDMTQLDDYSLEVGVTLTGAACPVSLSITGSPAPAMVGGLAIDFEGRSFRTMARLSSLDVRLDDPFHPDIGNCELQIEVIRRLGTCSMSAVVSGDTSGTFFGDGAYFNTFDEGAPITTGTMFDPGAVSIVGGQAYLDGLTAMADDDDFADLPGFGDKFGLTLADIRYDEEKPAAGSTAGVDALSQALTEIRQAAGAGGQSNAAQALGQALGSGLSGALSDLMNGGRLGGLMEAMGTLLGRFTLEASAPGDAQLLSGLGQGLAGQVNVPLSLVRVTAGAADDELSAVKFVWSDGQPGSAQLFLNAASPSGNTILGRVVGTLFTENHYNGRRLSIDVEAHFAAQRGFRSCIR